MVRQLGEFGCKTLPRRFVAMQAAEKGLVLGNDSERRSSGPKGPIDSVGFMRGLKTPAWSFYIFPVRRAEDA